jgi:hypothetical protein
MRFPSFLCVSGTQVIEAEVRRNRLQQRNIVGLYDILKTGGGGRKDGHSPKFASQNHKKNSDGIHSDRTEDSSIQKCI